MKKSFGVLFILLLMCTNVFAEWDDPSVVRNIFSNGSVADIQDAMNKGVPMNRRYFSGAITPFLFAASGNKPEVIEFLLKKGSKVSERDGAQATALLCAIADNPNLEVIHVLLKAGAKLSDRDFNGWTALMYATHHPNPEVFKLILKLGGKVNDKDYEGATALTHAIRFGSESMVQDLLNAGANINAQDNKGFTPLMQAVVSRSPEFVTSFIKAGAKVSLKTKDGASAMVFAAAAVDKIDNKTLKILADAGLDINEKDKNGRTPLMAAAMFNSKDMDRFTTLIEAGAKLEVRDNEGNTALLYAAQYNQNPQTVITLLKAGADSTVVNKQGKSALSLIQENQNGKNTVAQEVLERAPKAANYQAAQKPKELFSGAWKVNADTTLSRYLGYWKEWPGNAKAVAHGGNATWFLGVNKTDGGYEIFKYQASGWEKVSGGASRIAVGPDGEPWIVTDTNKIYHRVGGKWQSVPGRATDIGVGANGAVWIIGSSKLEGGFEIMRWDGSDWKKIDGAAVRVAVDPQGNPWVINNLGMAFYQRNGVWEKLDRVDAKAVAIDKDGNVLVIRKMDYVNLMRETRGNVVIWKDDTEEIAIP